MLSVARRSLIAACVVAAMAAQPILADEPVDARGNSGNMGSGAAFDPQTPEDYGLEHSIIDEETGDDVAGATTSTASASVLAAVDADMADTSVISGCVLHGEGDLLLIETFTGQAVLQLPYSDEFGMPIEVGSEVQAMGIPLDTGIFTVIHLAVWPAP
jgi:hypothetical protein